MTTQNITNITPPRVPLIDQRTGLISREWYRFFLNLFNLTGAGTNSTSISDLLVGPPATQENLTEIDNKVTGTQLGPQYQDQSGDFAITLQESQLSYLVQCCANLQAELDTIKQQLQTLPPTEPSEVAVVKQELETLPRSELGTMSQLQQAWLPWVTFDNAPSPLPPTVGTVAWDGGTTLGVQATANVIIRVGEAEYVYVKASSAITKGQVCYHTGAVGASSVITAAPTPLSLSNPDQIVGVAAETIALNGFGLIQISGVLKGFNTTGSSVGETWADGDPLYYNPAYVGSFTKTKPSAPNQKTFMGEVINAGAGSSGSVNVRIVPGSILGGTDSNVQFGTLANGDLIQYDSALQYWKNVPSSTFGTGTVTSVSVVSANGFAGTVATATTTPAITLSTSISGLLYGNGTSLAATTVNSPLTYSAGTLSIPVATSSANGYLSSTDWTTFNNKQSVAAPVTYTANFSVASTDIWIINNKSGSSCTVTLPTASSNSGRKLTFQNYQAQTLVSASSNVVPIGGGSAGTAILDAVAGNWATLVSDGTNWVIMQAAANNCLLTE